MLRSNIAFLTLTFLFLTGACDTSSGDTDSASGSTTTTTESTTESTTGEPPTTSAATEDDATTLNEDPTVATSGEDTEGDTTTSSTTGPVDPEHQSACEAACQRMSECDAEVDVADCVIGCTQEFQGPAECVAANLTLVQCVSELSCLGMEDQLDEGPCGDELEALEACDGSSPGCTQALEQGDVTCGVSILCPDVPTQEFTCDGDTCTCLVDGVEVGQCPAEGVCMEGDALFDKMASCCDFG